MSKSFIGHLKEVRAKAFEEAKVLLDHAASENRDLTAEENQKYDRINSEIDALDERCQDISSKEARSAVTDKILEELLGDEHRGADADPVAAELRSILAQRTKIAGQFTSTGKEMARALATTTATVSNVIPSTFLAQLIEPMREFSPLYAAGATVLTTASGEEMKLPRLATFGAAVAATEATQIGGTDPTFGQLSFKAYKYGQYMGVSQELIEDSAIDIEGLVSRLIGENVGYLFGQKLSVGVGTTEPLGLATAATAGVTGAGVTPTADELIDLQESVLSPYQVNSSWIGSGTKAIRKLKDGEGRYLWQPSLIAGQPDMLLGRPYFRDPYMDAPGAGKKSLLYGDVSRYWVRMVNAVRVERSEHFLFGSDQIAFRGIVRGDGNLVDPGAVKAFVGA